MEARKPVDVQDKIATGVGDEKTIFIQYNAG
jgi:hypothetical protein